MSWLMLPNGISAAGRNCGGSIDSRIVRDASEPSSSTMATEALTTSITALLAGV